MPPVTVLGPDHVVHAFFAGPFGNKGFAACFLAPFSWCGGQGRGLRRINGVGCGSSKAVGRYHDSISIAMVPCFPIMTTANTTHNLLPLSHIITSGARIPPKGQQICIVGRKRQRRQPIDRLRRIHYGYRKNIVSYSKP